MDLLSLGSLCVSCFLQVHSIYASRIKEVQVEQCVLEIECLTKQNFCWKDKPQDVLASMTLLLTLEVPQESEVRVDKHLQVHHMIMGVGDRAQHENSLKMCLFRINLQHLLGI